MARCEQEWLEAYLVRVGIGRVGVGGAEVEPCVAPREGAGEGLGVVRTSALPSRWSVPPPNHLLRPVGVE